ncbi:MAG: hypothetical protein K0S38_492 [Candidatus Paceibacter sp.]|jgi:hypothetical protein|nr:hypothetical protein [Candidatus Paceibacter sp.]
MATNEPSSFQLPSADCLVIHGRGIELVQSGESYEWQPADEIQKLPLERGAIRSLYRDTTVLMNNREGFIAGGTAVAWAASLYLSEMIKRQETPDLVIYSGGRPKYLEEAIKQGLAPADFNEGIVMQKAVENGIKGFIAYRSEIHGHNRNTSDEVMNSLEKAINEGLHRVVYINTSIALPRTAMFYFTAGREKYPQVHASFLSAERIIAAYGFPNDSANAWAYQDHINALLESDAGIRTAHMELIGQIRQLNNQYTRRGNY